MATSDLDIDAILDAALGFPKSAEERRRAFAKMIEEAEAEAARDGTCTIDEVIAEMDAIIARKA
jgi:hypothetical protein